MRSWNLGVGARSERKKTVSVGMCQAFSAKKDAKKVLSFEKSEIPLSYGWIQLSIGNKAQQRASDRKGELSRRETGDIGMMGVHKGQEIDLAE